MTQQDSPAKRRNADKWKAINGACKMSRLSDGYEPRSCVKCGTSHKLKICPWCGQKRGRK